MAEEKALAHVKPSFLNNFRMNVLGHNCSYVDFDGKMGTLKYPPTKQYPSRLTKHIQELHITNVPTIADKSNPIDDLRHFKYLRKLTLGKGVTGITMNSIPSSVEELTLSQDVTSIPKGYLSNGNLHIISGPGYKVDTGTTQTNDIFYLDEFQRLVVEISHFIGIGLEAHETKRGVNIQDFTTYIKLNMAESIIRHSNEFPNSKSLYVYARSMGHGPDTSIKLVLDSYPMPEKRKEGLDDEKLIALLVVDEKKLDLSKLQKQYPNLQRIFVADSVKQVTEMENTFELASHGFETTLPNGKKQQVILLSDKTTPIKKAPTVEPSQGKENVQEIDKEDIEK